MSVEKDAQVWVRINQNTNKIADLDKNLALTVQNLATTADLLKEHVKEHRSNTRDWRLAAISMVGKIISYAAVGAMSYFVASISRGG